MLAIAVEGEASSPHAHLYCQHRCGDLERAEMVRAGLLAAVPVHQDTAGHSFCRPVDVLVSKVAEAGVVLHRLEKKKNRVFCSASAAYREVKGLRKRGEGCDDAARTIKRIHRGLAMTAKRKSPYSSPFLILVSLSIYIYIFFFFCSLCRLY